MLRPYFTDTCRRSATAADYSAHCVRFETLKTAGDGTMRERDIPWPAPTNIVLASPGDTRQELKSKVTQAMMRWWGLELSNPINTMTLRGLPK
jgi:hypothetical protein